jgi:hypothetical protein
LISNLIRTAMLLTVAQEPSRLDDPAFREELIALIVRYLRA